jgi:hypothetical protein
VVARAGKLFLSDACLIANSPANLSNFHACAQFDYPVWWQAEV